MENVHVNHPALDLPHAGKCVEPIESATLPLGGRVAGRYAVRRLLGRGGHGEVWEALDGQTGDRVALKLVAGSSDMARVRREVSSMTLLTVPGVVRLLDQGTDRGRHYIVMEHVEGSPFPGLPGRRRWRELAGVTVALLGTLERIHLAGVIHRDIKPSNVLVNSWGVPTVVDFGLASRPGDTKLEGGLGTPNYMAPEQVRNEAITPHADLFAVGVMLYEALAGRLPHQSESMHALFYQKRFDRPVPLQDIAPGVPLRIARVIHRMVSGDADERPGTAAEVLRLLSRDEGFRAAEGQVSL